MYLTSFALRLLAIARQRDIGFAFLVPQVALLRDIPEFPALCGREDVHVAALPGCGLGAGAGDSWLLSSSSVPRSLSTARGLSRSLAPAPRVRADCGCPLGTGSPPPLRRGISSFSSPPFRAARLPPVRSAASPAAPRGRALWPGFGSPGAPTKERGFDHPWVQAACAVADRPRARAAGRGSGDSSRFQASTQAALKRRGCRQRSAKAPKPFSHIENHLLSRVSKIQFLEFPASSLSSWASFLQSLARRCAKENISMQWCEALSSNFPCRRTLRAKSQVSTFYVT